MQYTKRFPQALRTGAILGLLALTITPASAQQFLDITSLTTGTNGSFTGTMGAVSVTGAITTPHPLFEFYPTGPLFQHSTINGSSPQYSDANIYTPSTPSTDRVGYGHSGVPNNTATITITFSSAVTNPVLHVANLDSMAFDFASTAGLGGLSLLSGNGDGVDGLTVIGTVVRDAAPTQAGHDPDLPPPTTGARSAYGSVLLQGTFNTLTVQARAVGTFGDGGSFTLSTEPVVSAAAPEPGSLAMLLPLMGMVGMVVHRRKKLK